MEQDKPASWGEEKNPYKAPLIMPYIYMRRNKTGNY